MCPWHSATNVSFIVSSGCPLPTILIQGHKLFIEVTYIYIYTIQDHACTKNTWPH